MDGTFAELVKAFGRFGPNGLLLAVLWGSTAVMTLLGKMPIEPGASMHLYRQFLQLGLGTFDLICAMMFISWNWFGIPKRLGLND